MTEGFKGILVAADVQALVALDDFVDAMAQYFDSKDDLEKGFLQLSQDERANFLKQVDPDKALRWGVKVNVALRKRRPDKPEPQPTNRKPFVPAMQMVLNRKQRPKSDIPPLHMERRLLFFGDEGDFNSTGFYMTVEDQGTHMANLFNSKLLILLCNFLCV